MGYNRQQTMMKQKLLTLFLALAASAGITFAETHSGNFGANGANLTWTFDTETGTLTISRIGAMGSYTSSNVSPWYSYRSSITTVIIEDGVTTIGSSAFNGCSSLTSITIPNSVTSIGEYAFYRCSKLTSITIPNSVTSIEHHTFSNCSKLTFVTIPNSVTTIGNYAFSYCHSLTSIEIPNSVTSIGDNAFSWCYNLTSIEIPNSVTSIGSEAFGECSSLTSITISNSVTSIGDGAFYGCSELTSITIPNSVTSIGYCAFYGCSKLASVMWNAKKCNDFTYSNTPFYYYDSSNTSNNFDLNEQITSFTFGDNVEYIPASLCSGMSNLTSITIPKSVTSIGDYAFYECTGLTSVTIPNSVTSIGQSAFGDCSSLSSVTIANSVTSIGESAFNGCSSLTSVTIPNSVTSIGKWAFYYCTSLTSISCEAVTPPTLMSTDVFWSVSIPLYVPAQSINLYKSRYGWKNFTNILPITSSTPETFTITFLNYDGSELQSSEVEAGTMPQYNGATPTKPADEQYTYTFAGWTPEIVAVIGDATYTAMFEETLNTYTITWQDEDGNVIKTDQVAQGTTPAFTGTTPTKPATNEYTYEFAGWLPKIKPATENAKYTTFFERNKIETSVYTVNINGENCSLNINNQYPEGTVITLEAVADECFEFQQWSDGNTDNPRTITVTANTNLTAEFNKVRYTVTGQPSTGGKVQIRKQ